MASTPMSEARESARTGVPMWLAVIGFLGGASALHIGLHHHLHGALNVHQVVLASFLVLNVMINYWELALFAVQDDIQEEHAALKARYGDDIFAAASALFRRRIPLIRLLRFKEWGSIWSTYALYDPGYASRFSYGYNIDVGNGVSTIVPSTLFALAISVHVVPARWVGIVGVILFWQMFYGTVLYFFQFFNNRRHEGRSVGSVLLFVGLTNGMWFVLPIWGMCVSVAMILGDTYAVFGG